MPRELRPDVHWLYEAGPDRNDMIESMESVPDWYDPTEPVYIPQCAYLIDGDVGSLLFDTLSPASTEHVLAALDDLLDEPLDYLVVSHPEIPHAGNAQAVSREHDAEPVAPRYGDDHELYHLDEARLVGEGDAIDLGNYVVDFHEATFLDAPVSLWMTERTEEMLFPVDWMGFPLRESEKLRFVDELERDLDGTRLLQFHGRVLFWLRYVDPAKLRDALEAIFDEYDVSWVAPIHGHPIRGDDLDRHLDRLVDAAGRIAAEYDVPDP